MENSYLAGLTPQEALASNRRGGKAGRFSRADAVLEYGLPLVVGQIAIGDH